MAYVVCGLKRLLDQRGQSAVEFALILPLLLLFIVGGLDFAHAFNIQNDETHLANEAVRYAAVGSCSGCSSVSPPTIKNYIESQAVSGSVTVSFCFPPPANASSQAGDPVKATVTKTYNFLPFLSFFGLSATTQISGSSTMRL